jgi:hypothetical protein
MTDQNQKKNEHIVSLNQIREMNTFLLRGIHIPIENKIELEKCIEFEINKQCKIYIQKIGTTDFLTADIIKKENDDDSFTVSYTEIQEGVKNKIISTFQYTLLTKQFDLFRSPIFSRTYGVLKNSNTIPETTIFYRGVDYLSERGYDKGAVSEPKIIREQRIVCKRLKDIREGKFYKEFIEVLNKNEKYTLYVKKGDIYKQVFFHNNKYILIDINEDIDTYINLAQRNEPIQEVKRIKDILNKFISNKKYTEDFSTACGAISSKNNIYSVMNNINNTTEKTHNNDAREDLEIMSKAIKEIKNIDTDKLDNAIKKLEVMKQMSFEKVNSFEDLMNKYIVIFENDITKGGKRRKTKKSRKNKRVKSHRRRY